MLVLEIFAWSWDAFEVPDVYLTYIKEVINFFNDFWYQIAISSQIIQILVDLRGRLHRIPAANLPVRRAVFMIVIARSAMAYTIVVFLHQKSERGEIWLNLQKTLHAIWVVVVPLWMRRFPWDIPINCVQSSVMITNALDETVLFLHQYEAKKTADAYAGRRVHDSQIVVFVNHDRDNNTIHLWEYPRLVVRFSSFLRYNHWTTKIHMLVFWTYPRDDHPSYDHFAICHVTFRDFYQFVQTFVRHND